MSKDSLSPAPTGAEAIKEIVALAHQARGIDVVQVTSPPSMRGVPSSIPVGIRHGTSPDTVNLSGLFEPFRTRPQAKRGVARALTLRSFIDLVNRHKLENSAIFADTDWQKPSFEAVIDYHEASNEDGQEGNPDNLRHRVRYEFPLSDEWKAWTGIAGKTLNQADFAGFIEDHIAELASPFDAERIEMERDFQTTVASPADLMKLSRGLQVNVGAVVKHAVTLQTGEGQITYEQSHTDGEGKPLKVPGVFLLNIAPFFMGSAVRLPVRLRYRTDGGKIAWFNRELDAAVNGASN